MNVIFIISDTFRWDNLACYNDKHAHTPNLDRFAQESIIFENAYLGSFPTVPNRHDIMTGKHTSTFAGWQPLPENAITLQQILDNVGITTALISDTPHTLQRGFNYQRGFGAFEWIRGQENDHYRSYPKQVTLPAEPEKLRLRHNSLTHYLRNVSNRKAESDYFCAQTMTKCMEWLEENAYQGQFFLWVDTFDPHEPWDPPQKYVERYNPGYDGDDVIYPPYGFWKDFLTSDDLNHCRALYHGEVSLVDHWVGKLIDKIDALGLRDNTAVIFASDHGFLFGEHGIVGKSIITDDGIESIHQYQELVRIPLFIRLPGNEGGQRISAFVQPFDLMPTILELCGVIMTEPVAGTSSVQVLQCGMYAEKEWRFDPAELHGQSIMPLIRGEQNKSRDFVVCSNTLTAPSPVAAKCSIITEDGWSLFYAGASGAQNQEIRIGLSAVTDMEKSAFSFAPELYYLPDDPEQKKNVIADYPDIAESIHKRYVAYLEELGTDERYLQYRRDLFREDH